MAIVLLGEEHGGAGLLEDPEPPEERADHDRGEPFRRLVEHQ
jgi:hypothetical protein